MGQKRKEHLAGLELKKKMDADLLKESMEDAGFHDSFEILNKELGVESLEDLRLVESEDIDSLPLTIVKKRKLMKWVRKHHLLPAGRMDVQVSPC